MGEGLGEQPMSATSIRRPEKALTAQFVRNIAEPGKYFDGHGLYLRIDKNGARFWVQRITVAFQTSCRRVRNFRF